MNDTVERFKARRALYGEFTQSPIHPDVLETPPSAIDRDELLSSVALQLDDPRQLPQMDPDTLLGEIREGLKEKHFEALVDSCKRECLQAVIRPFVVARVLFSDKEGGNVDTVHNVRMNVFATEQERIRYEEREAYEIAKDKYKQDKKYRDENAKISKRKCAEKGKKVDDSYTDNQLGLGEDRDLDHVVPTSEVHNDAGVYLAELNPIELANNELNLKPTNASINRSKNGDTAKQFAARLRQQSEARKEKIKELESLDSLTDKQAKELNKLKKLETVNEEKLLKADDAARKEMNSSINKAYYTSNKFIGSAISTGISEGRRMGTQQALGVLMEEFVLAAFDEVKDAWKNGFVARVDDGFLAALKERLMRVVARVLAKWREALTAFKDGSISGFLSNLVTVIINMFFTTSARLVRVIREGFMSLYRALKLLICPPEGMSFAEAADAATKLLAAGCVTGVGVMLEQWVETHLLFLGPLAPYASTIVSALVTGLGTVFVTYMLERLDLFGVQAKCRHDKVMTKLNDMVCISYEKALEDSAIFSEPALLHLT